MRDAQDLPEIIIDAIAKHKTHRHVTNGMIKLHI